MALTTVGIAFVVAVLYLGQGLATPWLLSHYGPQLSLGLASAYEWQLLVLVWLAGMVIGLLPAARTYRYSLCDGMSIRV